MPNFVFLSGPQAVGKMTVGQELAKLTGYKLFYNHMTIEIVRLIFDYDKTAFWNVNTKMRDIVFEEFSKSNEKGIIFTGCFDFGSDFEADKKIYDKWTQGYEKKYFVELEADLEERLKRNKTANRLKYKVSKRDLQWSEKDLLTSVEIHKLNSDYGQGERIFENYMRINNTNISAKDVAAIIAEKWNLCTIGDVS